MVFNTRIFLECTIFSKLGLGLGFENRREIKGKKMADVEESEDSVYSIYRQPDCIKSLFNEEVSLSLKRKRGSRGGKKKAKGSKQPKLI